MLTAYINKGERIKMWLSMVLAMSYTPSKYHTTKHKGYTQSSGSSGSNTSSRSSGGGSSGSSSSDFDKSSFDAHTRDLIARGQIGNTGGLRNAPSGTASYSYDAQDDVIVYYDSRGNVISGRIGDIELSKGFAEKYSSDYRGVKEARAEETSTKSRYEGTDRVAVVKTESGDVVMNGLTEQQQRLPYYGNKQTELTLIDPIYQRSVYASPVFGGYEILAAEQAKSYREQHNAAFFGIPPKKKGLGKANQWIAERTTEKWKYGDEYLVGDTKHLQPMKESAFVTAEGYRERIAKYQDDYSFKGRVGYYGSQAFSRLNRLTPYTTGLEAGSREYIRKKPASFAVSMAAGYATTAVFSGATLGLARLGATAKFSDTARQIISGSIAVGALGGYGVMKTIQARPIMKSGLSRYEKAYETSKVYGESAPELLAFYTGAQAASATPQIRRLQTRAQFETELHKLTKYEQEQAREILHFATQGRKIKPSRDISFESVRNLPKRDLATIREFVRSEGGIGYGSATHTAYGVKTQPRDVEFAFKHPASEGAKLASKLHGVKVKYSNIGEQMESAKFFYKGHKFMEFHTTKWIKADPFYSGTYKTPSGQKIIKLSEQTSRKVAGAFIAQRTKDYPHIKELLPQIYKGAVSSAEKSLFLKESKLQGLQQSKAKLSKLGFKFTPKPMKAIKVSSATYTPKVMTSGYTAYKPYSTYTAYTTYKPYSTYKPYQPYKPYSTYKPYKPYSTYTPYTTYKPYTPYTPKTTYTPYTPYKQYTPYTSYTSYTPYTPYVPYTPYTPYYPTYPTKTPPIIPVLPTSPGFDIGGFGKSTKSTYKRKLGYNPSLVALSLGIKGKKPGKVTGIGIRPMISKSKRLKL